MATKWGRIKALWHWPSRSGVVVSEEVDQQEVLLTRCATLARRLAEASQAVRDLKMPGNSRKKDQDQASMNLAFMERAVSNLEQEIAALQRFRSL